MKSVVWALLAAILWASPVVAAPLEIYGRRPAMDQVQISPGGSRIAFIAEAASGQRVVVQDAAQRKIVAAASGGELKIRSIQWADEDRLIIVSSRLTSLRGLNASTNRSEFRQGSVLTVSKNSVQPLLYDGATEGVLILRDKPVIRRLDGVTAIFVASVAIVDNTGRNAIFRTDLARRRTTLVKAGEPTTSGFLLDGSGEILAEAEYFEQTEVRRIKLRGSDGLMHTVPTPEGVTEVFLMGLGQGGQSVFVEYEQDGKKRVASIALDSMAWSEPLTDASVDGMVWHPTTDEALGYRSDAGESNSYTFFNPVDQNAWRSVLAAYPGQRVSLLSITDSRRQFIVRVDGPAEGLAYAHVDLDAKTAHWLGEAYPGLTPKDISPVRTIAYKAADGLEITGYLTLPHGVDAANLPLVVLPHGGPSVRYYPEFHWWSQALATRGYAVLRPNVRGSGGLGPAFLDAGHGELGRKMLTDLSDGVRHLAAEGIIDPRRVCIVGASYGGYAALAGATIDRGVYRCAVSVGGPADLKRMLTDTYISFTSRRFWTRFMGVDGARDQDLALISPAAMAEHADIPVLLIHGNDDVVVPFEQSTLMAEAMRKAGKPVELITLDGEDHWLSRSETRLQMLESTVAFLERHNPPDPPAQIADQTASLP